MGSAVGTTATTPVKFTIKVCNHASSKPQHNQPMSRVNSVLYRPDSCSTAAVLLFVSYRVCVNHVLELKCNHSW